MAVLNDFRVAEFSQGTRLSGDFTYKKDAQPGVCLALVVSWFRVLSSGKVASEDDLMKAIAKDFGMSIVRQSVFDDSMRNVASITWAGLADKWNSVSTVTGISFGLEDVGMAVDPMVVATFALATGTYVLRITFNEGGGHAIGFAKVGDEFMFFDPNLGLFAVDDLATFATLLWQKYRVAFRLTVNDWGLYSMTKAETARERMVAALAKLK